MPLPRLPLGLSDFAGLRESGPDMVYVDKTGLLAEFLAVGKYLFLARPRRFGKSLLCSTIKYLYEGRREFFAGLAIESRWDWSRTNPVVHLSLTDVGCAGPEELTGGLGRFLVDRARADGLNLPVGAALPELLKKLLEGLHHQTGRKAVVIIDE